MSRRQKGCLSLLLALMLVSPAHAQDSSITPTDSSMQRITPQGGDDSDSMLSTHPVKKAPPQPSAPPPAAPTQAAPAILGGDDPAITPASPPPAPVAPTTTTVSTSPFKAATPAAVPATPSAAASANPAELIKPGSYQPTKIPFGRSSSAPVPGAPEVPSGPHTAVAVPVSGVDAVEVSEPAPPAPVAPGADPVNEDAAKPTELTSPIFDGAQDSGAPRKIVFRALNKVTGQSTLFTTKPNDTVKFGKIEITAIMCRTSIPTSQTDYAGLLDIREQQPDTKLGLKPLFRGWMYASSPSITGLEHPIYDVTMVSCDIAGTEPKPPEKEEKKAPEKKKK